MNLVINYGETDYDFSKFPETTLVAMLRRGVSHYFGSEAASKVLGKIERGIVQGATDEETKTRTEKFEALDGPARKAVIKQFRDGNPELIKKWHEEVQAEQVKAMEAGTVGVSVRGPAVDPLTTIINRLAKAEVVNTLKANKIAVPKKAEDAIVFPNGDKFTIGALVERRKAHAEHGPRLTKEAKSHLAAQERAAKKAAEAGLGDL